MTTQGSTGRSKETRGVSSCSLQMVSGPKQFGFYSWISCGDNHTSISRGLEGGVLAAWLRKAAWGQRSLTARFRKLESVHVV